MGSSPERAAEGLVCQAEAATLEAAGIVRSQCSAPAVWSQPSLLPVAHKPAQPSSKGPLGSAADPWTSIPELGSAVHQFGFGHGTFFTELHFPYRLH